MPVTDYPIVRLSDTLGNVAEPNSGPKAYALLTAATATGPDTGPIRGGNYIWTGENITAGVTLTLQRKTRAGAYTGFVPAATLTADGQVSVGVGQGAIVRVLVSGGTPANLFSDLSGIS